MSSLPNALTVARIALVPLFCRRLLPAGRGRALDRIRAVLPRRRHRRAGRHDRPQVRRGELVRPHAGPHRRQADRLRRPPDAGRTTARFRASIWCRPSSSCAAKSWSRACANSWPRADVSLPVTRIAKVKTTVQVAAIAALIASSATERMLPGVTIGGADRHVGGGRRSPSTPATPTFRPGCRTPKGDRRRQRPVRSQRRSRSCIANRDRRETALFRLGPAEDRALGRGACASRRTSPRSRRWSTSSAAAGPGYEAAFAKPELLRCAVNQEHARFDARVGPERRGGLLSAGDRRMSEIRIQTEDFDPGAEIAALSDTGRRRRRHRQLHRPRARR